MSLTTLAIILCVLINIHVQAEEKHVNGAADMVLNEISPGSFMMGSSPLEEGRKPGNDERQTMVTLDYRFWIGKYEVTQEEYTRVMSVNPSFFNGEREMEEGSHNFGSEPRRPVENVTWIEADQFCRELTKKEQERLRNNGYVYRLPTEAEWECACRAGTNSMFSFGDNTSLLREYAWCKGNSEGQTHPVGKLKANAWGLYDMHGNVMEWCHDWYQARLPGGSATNWVGPEKGSSRVLRGGGCFNDKPADFRCADRWHQPPTEKGNGYGFRIVLAPPIESLKKRQ